MLTHHRYYYGSELPSSFQTDATLWNIKSNLISLKFNWLARTRLSLIPLTIYFVYNLMISVIMIHNNYHVHESLTVRCASTFHVTTK